MQHPSEIYNTLLIDHNIMSSDQSSFKQGDLCMNQVLSITHQIYYSLDNVIKVRGIFSAI